MARRAEVEKSHTNRKPNACPRCGKRTQTLENFLADQLYLDPKIKCPNCFETWEAKQIFGIENFSRGYEI